MQPFSVLISVYKNDEPLFFSCAMDSILNQTCSPSEIVLVRDGKVPDQLQQTIDSYCRALPDIIHYIPLEENQGLGNALRIGVEHVKFELVARMDSDDIAISNRFEMQLKAFEENPGISIVGGQIDEFIDTEDNIVSRRVVPTEHAEIVRYCKTRSPMNHMTVMFRKSAVLAAGNYIELHFMEDYYLWCRMIANGSRFLNLNKCLVNMRVGSAMYRRRGGWNYFCSLRAVEKYKLNAKLISFSRYLINLSIRFVQCFLLPNKLRGWVFQKFARKSV